MSRSTSIESVGHRLNKRLCSAGVGVPIGDRGEAATGDDVAFDFGEPTVRPD